MQYFSFSVWLISLSIMPSRSIHVADGRISFFIADNILYMCIEKSYCLYPFVCQHAFRFPLYLKLKLKSLSPIQLFATPWTGAHQAPLSKGFFRQEYCSGWPFPPPGDFPNSRIEPASPEAPAMQADSLSLSHQGSP